LFVAAQHPNATGHFVHYESPRLRRDAKEDTKQLINQFNVVISGLINARRKDALEMGKALAKADKEAESSRQALAQREVELREQHDEIRDKDALITKYKALLGLDQ
jgi:uncharacterized protein YbcC (UPF0753/DUF2309 family)